MDKLARYSPPGGERTALDIALWVGGVVLFIVWMGFVITGTDAWQAAQGQTVPTLRELIKPWMIWLFGTLAMWSLLFVPSNYSYFRTGSKSYYTMHRVSDPWELHVRCWAVPLLGVAVVLGYAIVTYWFCCGTYFLFVENGMIPEQQIGLFWRYVP